MSSSGEVLATIPVDLEPRWVAITPDGNRAYVTLTQHQSGGLPTLTRVAVIDTRTNTVTVTINMDHPSTVFQPSGVAIAPDGRRAYVSNWDGRGLVNVIDTGTNTVIDAISVGRGLSTGIAITPNGRHVYVATGTTPGMPDEGQVSVIDTDTNTVVTTIRGNPFPSTVTVTPNGDFVYVLDTEARHQVIDAATHEPTFPHELETLFGGGRISFTPDGLHAYIADENLNHVPVVEVATRQLVGVIDVSGGRSTDVAVSRDGRHVCVTQRSGEGPKRQLWVIDAATRKVVGSPAKWSGSASGLAITPDGLTAYVADGTSRAVRVVPIQPRAAA
jgi:YVTN family beta-propeller protein